MRRFSLIVPLVVISVIFLLCFPLLVAQVDNGIFAEGTVSVSIDCPAVIDKSSNRYFHAYVSVSSVNDFYAAQYDITYDPDVIRVQDVSAGNIAGTSIRIEKWSYMPANTQGTLRIVNSLPTTIGSNDVSGEGYLADIYFKVMGDPGDSSVISFVEGLGDPAGYLMIGNDQGLEIAAIWIDGSVYINGAGSITTPTPAQTATYLTSSIPTHTTTSSLTPAPTYTYPTASPIPTDISTSQKSFPIWIVWAAVGGGILLTLILVIQVINKRMAQRSARKMRIKQLREQMDSWRREGYDVTELEKWLK